MSPRVHWPAPSSADEAYKEDSCPAPISPDAESKKRKRADDNSISRCELCKQRKVRSHKFILVSCHMPLLHTLPTRPLRTLTVGDCAYANRSFNTHIKFANRSNVTAGSPLAVGAVEMVPYASTRNAKSQVCALVMGVSSSRDSTNSRRSCVVTRRSYMRP